MGQRRSVTVKDLAVQRQTGTNNRFVFVMENGTAVRKNVTVGRQTDDRMEILSGLNAGDKVINAGMSRLHDGVEVVVIE
jgi:multidrug efflux pump subunit AcrA (membrane-fusion protein)